MADIALVTANRVSVVESIQQMSLPAAEAITAGAPVRIDTSTGKFTNANGTSAAEARVWGIASRTVLAGDALTAIRRGVLDGFALDALAYDAAVQLSNTDGRLDSGGTPTVVATVGRVIPSAATTTGTAYDKLLSVEL